MSLPATIKLGLWAPSLADQGFGPFLSPEDLERFQGDDLAISRLHIGGLITISAHEAARKKLAKKISQALKKFSGPQP